MSSILIDSDDTEATRAIVDHFNKTDPKTKRAAAIKDEFAAWYADLSWYERNVDDDVTFTKARNYRDAFNLANATSPEEREQVKRVVKEGMTAEQLKGQPAKARTSSGARAVPKPGFLSKLFDGEDDWLTPKGKLVLLGSVLVAGGGYIAYRSAKASPAGQALAMLRGKSKKPAPANQLYPHASKEAEEYLRRAISIAEGFDSSDYDAVTNAIVHTEAAKDPEMYLSRARETLLIAQRLRDEAV